jgi:alpha-tubulin suppressor-like RCC1 family protein
LATVVPGDPNAIRFIEVGTGDRHTLALTSSGDVYAWGMDGGYGASGDGTGAEQTWPRPVPGLNDMVAISAGEKHSVAVTSDGRVYTWGDNTYGQLGDGTTTRRLAPVLVTGISDVVKVAAGVRHTLAMTRDGRVYAWGDNTYGQLGDGTQDARLVPTVVVNITSAVDISVGGEGQDGFSIAATTNGDVFSWGRDWHGSLGIPAQVGLIFRSTPVQVQSVYGAVAVSAGGGHAFALTQNGRIWAWGENGSGQLGDGSDAYVFRRAPIMLAGLPGFVDVSAGETHSLAVTIDGKTMTWGTNAYGELGNGQSWAGWAGLWTPTDVPNLRPMIAGTAGDYDSFGITADGAIYAWGSNGLATLGDGTVDDRHSPVRIAGGDPG